MSRYKINQKGSFGDIMDGVVGDLSRLSRGVAEEIESGVLEDLRQSTKDAGLGQRLANTWRSRVYPVGGRPSLDPAVFVYSKAPDIIDSFDRGATIVPVNGSKYLAIPTKNVPRKGRGRRMTPFDVEDAFNQDLKFTKTKDGKLIAFIEAIQAKKGNGWRQATKGRLKQGRAVKIVVMFFLIPAAHMPKRFDLDTVAEYWGRQAQSLFDRQLNNL